MVNTKIFIVLFINLVSLTNGFAPIRNQRITTKTTLFSQQQQQPPNSLEDLISTPELWDPLKQSLNAVPTFACTNELGQPLQYNIGSKALGFFYTDIHAAQSELVKAQQESNLSGTNLKITPFPLGDIFEMGIQQKAVLIPSQESMEAAGAPVGINPVGQQVPLFGCMQMVQTLEDGTMNVPLFLSRFEAEEAMGMATANMAEGDKSMFQVDVVPLAGAIQMQANSRGERSFTFVSPTSSMQYLQSLE